MAYKTFANGFPLPASDLNNFLMNQSVIVFADAAARTSAIPSPVQGMLTYLVDTGAYESWNGSAFVSISNPGDITAVTAGTGLTGGGTTGDVTLNVDTAQFITSDTVTTSQDLIVADGASSVTRLGVGTDDQVLSVVAGAVAWADAGGGGTLIVDVTANSIVSFASEMEIGKTYAFAMPSGVLIVQLVDSGGTVQHTFSSTPTTITPTVAIASINIENESGSSRSLTRSEVSVSNPSALNVIEITSTQSLTLDSSYRAYVFGGGAGGGGGTKTAGTGGAAAGGGGSGYFATDTLTPGTYTATIGAGGSGSTGNVTGGAGGTSSISTITAAGGAGGGGGQFPNAGAGGAGGTGGNGGNAASLGSEDVTFPPSSRNGNDGVAGSFVGGGTPGAAGTGSSTPIDPLSFLSFIKSQSNAYLGGQGERVAGWPAGRTSETATLASSGGTGGVGYNNGPLVTTSTGGGGANGYILLVEVPS
jgi:hypothetical protein